METSSDAEMHPRENANERDQNEEFRSLSPEG